MKYTIDKKWCIQETNPKLIISFSLYGTNPTYTEGAVQNVLLAKVVYPNWTCRFYVDESVPSNVTDELLSLGAQVYFVHKNKFTTNRQRSLWRFLPLAEKCRVIFRDTDSRVNSREQQAVSKWIKSGKTYSRIWDNTSIDDGHFNPIMAGMWGAVSTTRKPLVTNIEKLIINWKIQGYRSDEMFLIKYIIPSFKGLTNCHIMGCGIDPAPLLYIKLEPTNNIRYKYDTSNPENKKYVPIFNPKLITLTRKDFNKNNMLTRKIKGGAIGDPIFPNSPAFKRNNLIKYFVNYKIIPVKPCNWF